MHIGELADRAGMSLRTIRHYDEVGLLVPSGRTTGGLPGLHGRSDLERLLVIRRMKPLGFSLDEMGELLRVVDGLPRRRTPRTRPHGQRASTPSSRTPAPVTRSSSNGRAWPRSSSARSAPSAPRSPEPSGTAGRDPRRLAFRAWPRPARSIIARSRSCSAIRRVLAIGRNRCRPRTFAFHSSVPPHDQGRSPDPVTSSSAPLPSTSSSTTLPIDLVGRREESASRTSLSRRVCADLAHAPRPRRETWSTAHDES